MFKYGCMAALAVACGVCAPVAAAQGQFFVAGQIGEATYNDLEFDDDSADTQAFSAGYRWQAGPIVQIGVEAGTGKVDEIGMESEWVSGPFREFERVGMEARYTHIGANARFAFGADSRWFAIARGGYMHYTQDVSYAYESRYNGQLEYSESGSFEESGGGAYFGGGVGVDITRNFSVNAMVNGYAYSDFESEEFDEEDVGTATTTTLGLEVRF